MEGENNSNFLINFNKDLSNKEVRAIAQIDGILDLVNQEMSTKNRFSWIFKELNLEVFLEGYHHLKDDFNSPEITIKLDYDKLKYSVENTNSIQNSNFNISSTCYSLIKLLENLDNEIQIEQFKQISINVKIFIPNSIVLPLTVHNIYSQKRNKN